MSKGKILFTHACMLDNTEHLFDGKKEMHKVCPEKKKEEKRTQVRPVKRQTKAHVNNIASFDTAV